MLHENGNDDIHQNKLRHEDESDEEDGSNDRTNATVTQTVVRMITVLTQGVLQNKDIREHNFRH